MSTRPKPAPRPSFRQWKPSAAKRASQPEVAGLEVLVSGECDHEVGEGVAVEVAGDIGAAAALLEPQLAGIAAERGRADEGERLVAGQAGVGVEVGQADGVAFGLAEVADQVAGGSRQARKII